MMIQTTYTAPNSNTCKCCGGTGTQKNNEGIYVICPCCNGTGFWNLPTITY